jgi:hypothetical protein
MPMSLLKECGDVFVSLVCTLTNLSFTDGIFLDIFKTAQITPLIKKPGTDTKDPAN